MMQGLRDNMKIIIWITAVVFLVGFGVLQLGGVLDESPQQSSAGVIAKINGEPVRYDEFMRIYNQMVQQLTQERAMQQGEDSYVREQAWQQIVRSKLMEQEARRRHIQITPEEIRTSIRLTPPEFVTRAPTFQTDGQFDYRKFLAELENPNSQLPWSQVEAFVAASLPSQKLQDQVVAAAKVSDGDIRDRFLLQNDLLALRYLIFSPDSFQVDTSRIGGVDIETYYKSHPEEFTGPAEVKVQVLLVPRLPGEADFAARQERLQGVVDQLRAEPDSFESYARTYSEIGSAGRGGDPGGESYFEDLRPVFRAGLRDVKPGQISQIQREERSLHVFRVDSRYPDPVTGRERIKYHEIAVMVQPGAETIRAARAQVGSIGKEAKRQGIAAVSTRRGLRTFASEYFAMGRSGNNIFERFPDLELWCFDAKVGGISRPIPSENGWYLYQILDRRKAGVRPIEMVIEESKLALIHSLKTARAEETAKQARAAIVAGVSEVEAAMRFGGRAGTADGVTRNGIINGVGKDTKSVGTLFALPPRTWSPVLTGPSGVLVAVIDSHTTPSEAEFQKQAAAMRQSILNERRQVAFVEWMQELLRRAKIVDYRENFFDV